MIRTRRWPTLFRVVCRNLLDLLDIMSIAVCKTFCQRCHPQLVEIPHPFEIMYVVYSRRECLDSNVFHHRPANGVLSKSNVIFKSLSGILYTFMQIPYPLEILYVIYSRRECLDSNVFHHRPANGVCPSPMLSSNLCLEYCIVLCC